MAITTPDAVPGEVIEAAWGDAVRTDLTHVDTVAHAAMPKAGGAFSGLVSYSTGVTPTSPNHITDKEYVDGNTVAKAGDAMTGNLRLGADPAVGTGVMIRPDGAVYNTFFADDSIHGILNANLSLTRAKTPVADTGGVFAIFRRSGGAVSSAVTLGTITIKDASSVNYNTTSDQRLKSVTRPVDLDEALAKVAAMQPVHYVPTAEPEPEMPHVEKVGFLAQDLVTVAPEAVTPGSGEPSDGDTFLPWMVDLTSLVPTLVAAVQALTARIEQLEAA